VQHKVRALPAIDRSSTAEITS